MDTVAVGGQALDCIDSTDCIVCVAGKYFDGPSNDRSDQDCVASKYITVDTGPAYCDMDAERTDPYQISDICAYGDDMGPACVVRVGVPR